MALSELLLPLRHQWPKHRVTEYRSPHALFVLALQLIAVFYLFKAESTIWLKGKRVVDEDDDGHLDGE